MRPLAHGHRARRQPPLAQQWRLSLAVRGTRTAVVAALFVASVAAAAAPGDPWHRIDWPREVKVDGPNTLAITTSGPARFAFEWSTGKGGTLFISNALQLEVQGVPTAVRWNPKDAESIELQIGESTVRCAAGGCETSDAWSAPFEPPHGALHAASRAITGSASQKKEAIAQDAVALAAQIWNEVESACPRRMCSEALRGAAAAVREAIDDEWIVDAVAFSSPSKAEATLHTAHTGLRATLRCDNLDRPVFNSSLQLYRGVELLIALNVDQSVEIPGGKLQFEGERHGQFITATGRALRVLETPP